MKHARNLILTLLAVVVLAAVTFTLVLSVGAEDEIDPSVYGDANGDGVVNILDLTHRALYLPGSLTVIGYESFSNCQSLTTVTIDDGAVGIGNYAFAYCYSLETVTISGSVTEIVPAAFYYCRVLKNVTIGEGGQNISDHAFFYCRALESITIPGGVTRIGQYAFANSGLKTINFEGTKAEWVAIAKGQKWNENTPRYVIHCTDGDLSK